ncbi:hypothetical protein RB195_018422 [Necator americanus]|uniref:Uncharacterized protein n=1 Tax=Necator americanus TaxID=51031 RepID=A0ABR1CC42_NECAM
MSSVTVKVNQISRYRKSAVDCKLPTPRFYYKMNAGRPRRDGPRGYCQAVRLLTAVQPKKHQRSDRILISFENSRRFRKDTDMLF